MLTGNTYHTSSTLSIQNSTDSIRIFHVSWCVNLLVHILLTLQLQESRQKKDVSKCYPGGSTAWTCSGVALKKTSWGKIKFYSSLFEVFISMCRVPYIASYKYGAFDLAILATYCHRSHSPLSLMLTCWVSCFLHSEWLLLWDLLYM